MCEEAIDSSSSTEVGIPQPGENWIISIILLVFVIEYTEPVCQCENPYIRNSLSSPIPKPHYTHWPTNMGNTISLTTPIISLIHSCYHPLFYLASIGIIKSQVSGVNRAQYHKYQSSSLKNQSLRFWSITSIITGCMEYENWVSGMYWKSGVSKSGE